MSAELATKVNTHVVDILGNVKGRDQPIMMLEKALELVATLPNELFLDKDVVFFDPFCKAGEILLACAMTVCRKRVEKAKKLVAVDEIQKELYESKRYFALAPDERHHRLSLRTFLGNTHSHNEQYNHIIKNGNYLSEEDGKLHNEVFEKEFQTMIEYIKQTSGKKKIVAVGNPPYQQADSGFGGSAKAIYNFFAEALIDCKDISEFVLVIPSRWFSAGKGVEEFRDKMISSNEIRAIHHFKQSKQVFPTVDVLGGVCFLHYQKGFQGETLYIEKGVETEVNFSKYDIVLDDPLGYPLVDKILNTWKGKFVGEVAWSRKPFGIATDYFKKNGSLSEKDKGAIACYSKRRSILYANIKDVSKNQDKIADYKVCVPAAYAPGSKLGVRRVALPVDQHFVIPKGYITAETYTVVASFKSKQEAENFCAYLKTDFARYFLALRKLTQHVPKDRWNWVPMVDASKAWTDKELFKLFKITPQEQEHIKEKLQEWS